MENLGWERPKQKQMQSEFWAMRVQICLSASRQPPANKAMVEIGTSQAKYKLGLNIYAQNYVGVAGLIEIIS